MGRGLGLVGIPEHHFSLHGLEEGVTAVGIGAGLLIQLGHPLHVQIIGLEFHQAAFQGGLGLSVGELGHPWIGSWIALGRLGTAGWAGS